MPQEESKRGAHFAKRSASQASASEASSVDDQIRNAWSAAADPGETAVYLRAAGAGAALPRTILSSGRPDETAVFLAAAQSRAGRMPAAAGASRAPRPDETAVFLMAAQGKGTLKGAPADRSARHATDGSSCLWMTSGHRSARPIRSRALLSTTMIGAFCRFLIEPLPPGKLTRCLVMMP